MAIPENLAGRIVISRAGHDKGMVYVCLAADGTSLTLADGKQKKIASPKRKNRKHVQLTNGFVSPGLLERLENVKASDEELNRELRLYAAKIGKSHEFGGNVCQKVI